VGLRTRERVGVNGGARGRAEAMRAALGSTLPRAGAAHRGPLRAQGAGLCRREPGPHTGGRAEGPRAARRGPSPRPGPPRGKQGRAAREGCRGARRGEEGEGEEEGERGEGRGGELTSGIQLR
jgi:hypothetical protein